jgi:hypothetical protein
MRLYPFIAALFSWMLTLPLAARPRTLHWRQRIKPSKHQIMGLAPPSRLWQRLLTWIRRPPPGQMIYIKFLSSCYVYAHVMPAPLQAAAAHADLHMAAAHEAGLHEPAGGPAEGQALRQGLPHEEPPDGDHAGGAASQEDGNVQGGGG